MRCAMHNETVHCDLQRKLIKSDIRERFAVFGMDERCKDCDLRYKCAQAQTHPGYSTTWECERHPGALIHQFWARRRNRAKATGRRLPGTGVVDGATPSPSALSPTDFGKEAQHDAYGDK